MQLFQNTVGWICNKINRINPPPQSNAITQPLAFQLNTHSGEWQYQYVLHNAINTHCRHIKLQDIKQAAHRGPSVCNHTGALFISRPTIQVIRHVSPDTHTNLTHKLQTRWKVRSFTTPTCFGTSVLSSENSYTKIRSCWYIKHYIRNTHCIRHAAVVCCQFQNEFLEIRHECLFPHPSNPPLKFFIFNIRIATVATLALRPFSYLQCNSLSFSIQQSSGFRNAGPGVNKTVASGCSGECCCKAVTHPRTNQAQCCLNCS